MNKRIKLTDRILPDYLKGEEIMNTVTHIVGGGLSVIALLLCVLKSCLKHDLTAIITSSVYGFALICLYTMSSVYHGLRPSAGKKVMQVLDHCTIYFLIAGTYTPIVLCSIRQLYPILGWCLFAAEWSLAFFAVTLTAIDLRKYRVFSMICYIGMGWAIILFLPQAMASLTKNGFYLTLAGGIAYTIGAVLYGIGSKKHWMHSIFHIFVVLGSILQFFAIFLYVL